jgi:hypothetical protein
MDRKQYFIAVLLALCVLSAAAYGYLIYAIKQISG